MVKILCNTYLFNISEKKSGQAEILKDNLILPGGCPAGQAQYFPYF